MILLAGMAASALTAPSAGAAEVTALDLGAATAARLAMGHVRFANGHDYNATVGFGSGAFHRPGDPPGTLYAVTDRGPNIDCAEIGAVVGMSAEALCAGDTAAKVFPFPAFTPTIYTLSIGDAGVEIVDALPIKTRSGRPITGLPNPLTLTDTEGAFDADGRPLTPDASGLDVEAVARAADGSFWVAEEYGPSIVHIADDGRVLVRYVPQGLEKDLAAADYTVKGTLPAILAKRKLNRGIESLGLSADGRTLYAALQSPLVNPDTAAYKTSRAVRLLKIDAATGEALNEYVYPEDEAASFTADAKAGKVKQSDVKISELVVVGQDKLVVLERISKTTKFHLVELGAGASDLLGSPWDDPKTSPSLEATPDLAAKGVIPLSKTLMLTAEGGPFPEKIESIALLDESTLVVISDNDFAITGDQTKVVRIALDKPWN
ncbi:hypothetical protein F11_06360 [Rhodospirillum rubrum F11]|nr:hypothetical protein F11_06360 [Rhodospirillum rubrum F11]